MDSKIKRGHVDLVRNVGEVVSVAQDDRTVILELSIMPNYFFIQWQNSQAMKFSAQTASDFRLAT